MTILNKLLKEIKSDDKLEQIQRLCSLIFEEEKVTQKYLDLHPRGPNLFLVLEIPGKIQGEIGFLGLERESESVYLTNLYIIKKTEVHKKEPVILKKRTWEIKDHRPEKILISFAKQYKILIGE